MKTIDEYGQDLDQFLKGFQTTDPNYVPPLTPIERIAISLESIAISLEQLVNPNNGGLNVNAECHVSQGRGY